MVTADFVADEPEVPAAAEELAPDTGPPAAPASTPGVPIAVDPEARAPPATPAPPPVTSDDAPTEPPLFPATAGPPRAAASRSAPERRDPHAATAQTAKTRAIVHATWLRRRGTGDRHSVNGLLLACGVAVLDTQASQQASSRREERRPDL